VLLLGNENAVRHLGTFKEINKFPIKVLPNVVPSSAEPQIDIKDPFRTFFRAISTIRNPQSANKVTNFQLLAVHQERVVIIEQVLSEPNRSERYQRTVYSGNILKSYEKNDVIEVVIGGKPHRGGAQLKHIQNKSYDHRFFGASIKVEIIDIDYLSKPRNICFVPNSFIQKFGHPLNWQPNVTAVWESW